MLGLGFEFPQSSGCNCRTRSLMLTSTGRTLNKRHTEKKKAPMFKAVQIKIDIFFILLKFIGDKWQFKFINTFFVRFFY